MNTTGDSSNAIRVEPPTGMLVFTRAPVSAIEPPAGLFDECASCDGAFHAAFLPIVVWRDGAALRIVDGYKRWKSLAARGDAECSCGIIESPFDPCRAALLRIDLNSGRELSAREKYLFIRWLNSNLDRDAYLAQSQKLRIPPGERHDCEQLLSCTTLLIDAALGGVVDPAVAPEMGHLPETDIRALLSLFGSIAFSRQMQRELAEWLHEIAFLEKTTIDTLLATASFAGTLADTRLNAPQKAARIHEAAHALRYPLFSKTKQLWAEYAREINPDPRAVSFHPSPFFERRNLEIRIKLGDAKAAREIMQKLASVGEEDWEKLIDPTIQVRGTDE